MDASSKLPQRNDKSLLRPDAHSFVVPALVAAAGEDAARHFINFFIASIRNRHTRRSYARQAELFLSWCQAHGLTDIRQVRTEHVAAYIEGLSRSSLEPASVKQALSGLRMLFSWLVVHQVVPQNPTASVRGPKLVVSEGKTPYLPPEEVVRLIESIPTDTLVGLRDRALIGVMAYTFARVGATVGMNVGDFYPQGKQWSLRFKEKGGKRKQIAAHHKLEEYMDAYLTATGIGEEKGTPLFRTAHGKTGMLTENRMTQPDAWRMLQRRARKAGVTTAVCNHSWRASGITVFLENGGSIEMAQYMAGHADPRTTKLYDRRRQVASRGEVERIRYEKKQGTPGDA
ncbi:MAG: tyrosine-type recombinase/integrase [Rhodospirillales bacterium]